MFDPMSIVAYFEANPMHILLLLFIAYRYTPRCPR